MISGTLDCRNTALAGISWRATANDGPRVTPCLKTKNKQKNHQMPPILPLDIHKAPGCWNTANEKPSGSPWDLPAEKSEVAKV